MRKFNITFLSEIDQVEIRTIECKKMEIFVYGVVFEGIDNKILFIPIELIYRIEEV